MDAKSRVRVSGELRAFRDEDWLEQHESGRTIGEIAEESGVSVRHMKRAISRARKERESRMQEDQARRDGESGEGGRDATSHHPRWMELVPLFPVGAFTPTSKCPHHGPIRAGSLLCCMVCSASGVDGHPALARDPATDPRPEPKSKPKKRTPRSAAQEPSRTTSAPTAELETRRRKRARIYGSAPATASISEGE